MFTLKTEEKPLVVKLLKKRKEAPGRRSIRDFLVAELDKVKRTKQWPKWMVASGCLEASENKERDI